MENIKKMKKRNSNDINSDDRCNSHDNISNDTFSCDISNSDNIINKDVISNNEWKLQRQAIAATSKAATFEY